MIVFQGVKVPSRICAPATHDYECTVCWERRWSAEHTVPIAESFTERLAELRTKLNTLTTEIHTKTQL